MKAEGTTTSTARYVLALAAAFFTAIAIYGSLVPLNFRPLSFDVAWERFRQIPYLHLSLRHRADWVANILLFVPLGFCWLGTLSYARRDIVRWLGALFVLLCLALLTGAIEFTQLWFPPRTVSQNDIFAETLGAGIGIGLWLLVGESLAEWAYAAFTTNIGSLRFRALLVAYAAGYLVYSAMPLDLTISLHELHTKYEAGRILLLPFQHAYGSAAMFVWSLICDVTLLIPIGAAAWMCKPVTRSPMATALGLGVGYSMLVETIQLFVFSRYTDVSDLITGFVGVFLGVLLAKRLCLESTSAELSVPTRMLTFKKWLVALLVTVLCLLLIYWYPYNFSLDKEAAKRRIDGFTTALFEPMYWGSELHALVGILRKTITFGCLGAVAAMWVRQVTSREPARRVLATLTLAGCYALGLVIELGQILLPSHTAHMTDVLLFALGASVGYALIVFVHPAAPNRPSQ